MMSAIYLIPEIVLQISISAFFCLTRSGEEVICNNDGEWGYLFAGFVSTVINTTIIFERKFLLFYLKLKIPLTKMRLQRAWKELPHHHYHNRNKPLIILFYPTITLCASHLEKLASIGSLATKGGDEIMVIFLQLQTVTWNLWF